MVAIKWCKAVKGRSKHGTKTVAKAHGDDAFDPEKGFAVACAKKLLGNGDAFRAELAKWIPE